MNDKTFNLYFSPPDLKGARNLIVIGALISLCSLSAITKGGSVGLIIGVAFIGGGIALISKKKQGIPTDAQIDALLNENLHSLQDRALNQLGLDPSQVALADPIAIGYYTFGGSGARKGADGLWRSKKGEGAVFFFSQDQVHTFKNSFTLNHPENQTISTDEYFYRDVVSVSTQSTTLSLGTGKEKSDIQVDTIKLTTTGGTSVSCSIRDSSSAQKSIQGARALIADKKRSM